MHIENPNFTNKEQVNTICWPESWWHIKSGLKDVLTCRVKPTSNSHHSYNLWSLSFINISHEYMTTVSISRQIIMNAWNRFKAFVNGDAKNLSTLWMEIPANLAIVTCFWKFRARYHDRNVWCSDTALRRKQLDKCHPDCTYRSSNGCGVLKITYCRARDYQLAVTMDTNLREINRLPSRQECNRQK